MIFPSRIIYTILILFISVLLSGQRTILSFGSEYDNNFEEWFLISETEEEGELTRKWQLGNDFTEWSYELGDYSGNIRRRFDHRPMYWELRSSNGRLIEMDVKWRRDLAEWEIRSDGKRYKYQMPDQFDTGFWVLKDDEIGYWEFATIVQGDSRDWESFDELSEDVTFEFKMALVFIPFVVNFLAN